MPNVLYVVEVFYLYENINPFMKIFHYLIYTVQITDHKLAENPEQLALTWYQHYLLFWMYCRVNASTVEWNVAVHASFFNLRHRGFPVLSKRRRSFVDHHFKNADLVSLPLPLWIGKQRNRFGRVTGGDYRGLWGSGAGLHFCNFNHCIFWRSESPMKKIKCSSHHL